MTRPIRTYFNLDSVIALATLIVLAGFNYEASQRIESADVNVWYAPLAAVVVIGLLPYCIDVVVYAVGNRRYSFEIILIIASIGFLISNYPSLAAAGLFIISGRAALKQFASK